MGAFAYYGGKSLYAKHIAAFIESACEGKRVSRYIEPFCGWCAVASRLSVNNRLRVQEMMASDYNKSVVALWQGLSRGTFAVPTRVISKTEYFALKDGPPSALKAFAGICYSFNGKYYTGGYRTPVYKDSHRLQLRADTLKKVKFRHRRFDDTRYLGERGCVFYLDPPYRSRHADYPSDGTKGIQKEDFDTAAFWEVARRLAQHNVVIVSEYQAPKGWKCVLNLGKKGPSVNKKFNTVSAYPEKLFMLATKAPGGGSGSVGVSSSGGGGRSVGGSGGSAGVGISQKRRPPAVKAPSTTSVRYRVTVP